MNSARVNRTSPEQVFITVQNADSSAINEGVCAAWFLGTNATQANGVCVILPNNAVNLTAGIINKVAGVAHATISANAVGLLQVYGRDTVRASASIASGRMVVTGSINATNIGHVTEATTTTLTSPEYVGQIVGWVLENGPNATNATVMLSCL